ncbi:ribonuclease HI [Thermoflexibacter ruber]|uniref:ribonuclease H n=1 Tax=Thermoflexibacter ruber TaxID=1003 RepID=A0A1I2HYP5_9BACT|nr:ribonuclease HI [Thermoflexibacter ruber]SFF35032.1 RNase HI [Thermoflexibacter ruber]
MIEIYTDGASRGNPGAGGYGVILISKEHKLRKELSAGYRLTTNNRMELLAVIVGLEALKIVPSKVIVYSDSQYVINAVEKNWLGTWEKINFKNKKNADLWKRFLNVYKQHEVQFQWVRGHAGNPYNERCDELATSAADSTKLLVDEGYESEKIN